MASFPIIEKLAIFVVLIQETTGQLLVQVFIPVLTTWLGNVLVVGGFVIAVWVAEIFNYLRWPSPTRVTSSRAGVVCAGYGGADTATVC